jgi:hypothetical protein
MNIDKHFQFPLKKNMKTHSNNKDPVRLLPKSMHYECKYASSSIIILNHHPQPPSSTVILNRYPQPPLSTIILNHHTQPPSSTTILNHHPQPSFKLKLFGL